MSTFTERKCRLCQVLRQLPRSFAISSHQKVGVPCDPEVVEDTSSPHYLNLTQEAIVGSEGVFPPSAPGGGRER